MFSFEECKQYLHEDGKASTKIGAGLEAVPLQNVWSFLSLALSPQHFYLFQSAFLTAEAVLIFAFCSAKHNVSPEVIIINNDVKNPQLALTEMCILS